MSVRNVEVVYNDKPFGLADAVFNELQDEPGRRCCASRGPTCRGRTGRGSWRRARAYLEAFARRRDLWRASLEAFRRAPAVERRWPELRDDFVRCIARDLERYRARRGPGRPRRGADRRVAGRR